MRIKLLLAMVVSLTAIVTSNQSANAQTINLRDIGLAPKIVHKEEPKKPETPKPVEYVVVSGDTLKSLADAHTTTWERLYYKNPNITDPNLIKPGEKLIIPRNDEIIPERPVSTPVTPAQTTAQPISDNLYEPGQCVWYVKNRRPEIPNSWGNASNWLYAAQAQGWPTGTIPKAGAVGWTSGHVVYIESVNDDGTVNYSDMNGRWIPFEIGQGTAPADKYIYIY